MQGAQTLALLLQLGMVPVSEVACSIDDQIDNDYVAASSDPLLIVTAAISFYFTGTGAALMLGIAVQAHDMAELVCCGALHWTC